MEWTCQILCPIDLKRGMNLKLFNLLERDLNESPKINLKKNPLSPQADEKPADHPGLSSSEAAKRLRENGPNSLSQGKKVNAMKIFAGQFKDFHRIHFFS